MSAPQPQQRSKLVSKQLVADAAKQPLLVPTVAPHALGLARPPATAPVAPRLLQPL